MADQKLRLLSDELLKCRPEVEVEMTGGIEPNVPVRRLACVALRRLRRGDRIGCADTDQDRRGNALGRPAWSIADQAQNTSGRCTVHPLVAVGQQRQPT